MEYNEKHVSSYAADLSRKADMLAFSECLIGFMKGAIIGGAIIAGLDLTGHSIGVEPPAIFFASGALFAFLGFGRGTREGRTLRFQAHQIMCWAQIERNTRPASMNAAPTNEKGQESPALTFPLA